MEDVNAKKMEQLCMLNELGEKLSFHRRLVNGCVDRICSDMGSDAADAWMDLYQDKADEMREANLKLREGIADLLIGCMKEQVLDRLTLVEPEDIRWAIENADRRLETEYVKAQRFREAEMKAKKEDVHNETSMEADGRMDGVPADGRR